MRSLLRSFPNSTTRRNEDEVLKELENNVALKIGLRSVVRNMQAATDSPIDSIPLPCPLSGASKKAEPGVEAGGTLIDNLEDSGIYAIGETSTEKLSDGYNGSDQIPCRGFIILLQHRQFVVVHDIRQTRLPRRSAN
jgi:hypothetical protein